MLFSGSVKSYKCSKCGRNLSSSTPTSVIPILIVIIASTVLWAGNISEFFKLKSIGLLIALIIGFFLTIGIFFLTFVFLQKAFFPWEKHMKCPECKGNLEITGGGFIDGVTPGLHEILLYIVVIAIPSGFILLIS